MAVKFDTFFYARRMKHERINHYEENPLKSECDICGRPFKNTQQLSKHRMTHLNPEERKDYRFESNEIFSSFDH